MAWGKRGDMIVHSSDPYNAEPPRRVLAGAELTPADAFYVRNHGPVPRGDPSAHRLHLDGLVAGPRVWTVDGLRSRFGEHQVLATLQCAGNRRAGLNEVREIPGQAAWGPGATSTARWTGVRLADVLAEAGVHDSAAHVAFEAPDVSDAADPPQRFGGSIPLRKAVAAEVLLAWAMNGERLPAVHGAPLRVVVPGYIGARSVKWLERVTLRRTPSANWFQDVAYRIQPDGAGPRAGFALGPISVNSDVLDPDDGARVPPGRLRVRGYALAGDDREVPRVDVSTDGGHSWVQAELGARHGPWSWRMWRADLEVGPGPLTVLARAWDSAAGVQPESPAQVWNPGGYANNAWARVRLRVG